MAITSFQPTIWAKELQRGLENKLVSEACVNHDYEGDASNAVAVKINTVGALTVADYAAGTPLNYQTPSTTDTTLAIDKKKVIPLSFDDIELAQTADGGKLMIKSMEQAGYDLANEQDGTVFAEILDNGVETANTLGSDVEPVAVVTAEDAVAVINDLVTLADEANVPADGRVIVCPPKFINALGKDPKISMALSMSKSAKTGDLGIGFEGELQGCMLYKSNNLKKTNGNNAQVLLTHPRFNTEANQQNRVKSGDKENQVGQWAQAINVYGVKAVIKKSAKAIITYNQGE